MAPTGTWDSILQEQNKSSSIIFSILKYIFCSPLHSSMLPSAAPLFVIIIFPGTLFYDMASLLKNCIKRIFNFVFKNAFSIKESSLPKYYNLKLEVTPRP